MHELKKEIDRLMKEKGLLLSEMVNLFNNELPLGRTKQSKQNMFNKLKNGTIRHTDYILILKVLGKKIEYKDVE